MAAKLKVFGGNWCGLERRIVAATTKAKAKALMGVEGDYCDQTGNAIEVEVAMSAPGTVFGYRYADHKGRTTAATYQPVD